MVRRCDYINWMRITIPHDRVGALNYVQKMQEEGTVVTGLLYVDTDPVECHDIMGTVKTR